MEIRVLLVACDVPEFIYKSLTIPREGDLISRGDKTWKVVSIRHIVEPGDVSGVTIATVVDASDWMQRG